MKKTVRLFAAILAMLMLAAAFTACGDTATGDTETTAAQAVTTAAPEETTDDKYDSNGYIKDDLPTDLSFSDNTINILYWSDVEHEEFQSEGDDGDLVLSSIYKRNVTVEERLGLKMNWVGTPGNADNKSAWNSYVSKAIQSGTHEYDVMAGYSLSVVLCCSNGYLFNMMDEDACPYLNFDQPWWSKLLVEQATFNNRLYFASGDISRNALEMMYVCFCNTDILEDHKLENPQNLVESGDWTYDVFIQYCQGIYEGDGSKNTSTDTFGYMSSGIHNDPWFYGSGATICEKDENDQIIPSESFSGERVINTLDKFISLFNSQDGVYTSSVLHQTAFAEGRLLFMTDRARVSHKKIAAGGYDVNFVILPCPKYDKDQENYITVMGNPFTLYGIFTDCQDTKKASAFIECMASEGYRTVTPAVFELSLKTKYVDDPTSGRMYDIIRENVTYDLGRLFSADLIGQGTFRSAIALTSNTWKTLTKSSVTSLKKLCKTLNAKLDALQ